MKTPTIIAVVVLHIAIFAMILVQPGCKSSEESINPDLTAPEPTEVPARVDGAQLPPEGSDALRVAPTRPVYRLGDRGANEVPTDTFVQPEEELVPPATTTLEPEIIAPKRAAVSGELVRHTVKRGDNLTKIAKTYDTTVNAIMEANKMGRNDVLHVGKTIIVPVEAPASATAPAQQQQIVVADASAASSAPSVYVVQKGDTLSKIAGKFNTSVGKIMTLNGMSKTNIREGQKLKIPAMSPLTAQIVSGNAKTHKVANGETLGGIAIKYKVPLKTLMETNGITDPRKLRVGQVLLIGSEAAPAAPRVTTSVTAPVVQQQPQAQQAPTKVEPTPAPVQQQTQVPAEAVTNFPEVKEESVDL